MWRRLGLTLTNTQLTYGAIVLWMVVGAIFLFMWANPEPYTTEPGEVACDALELYGASGEEYICYSPPPMSPEEEDMYPVVICEASATASVDASTPCREYEP